MSTINKKYVAYFRVSTQKQGKSGLGLEAQKSIVNQFLSSNMGILISEYTEIESGRKKDRKILEEALTTCKHEKAILLIAKLDRLARSVSFVFALRDSGIPFVACDLPDFNTLTLGIFASFAQYEAERISQRVKDALNAKKARGYKLGSPKGMSEDVRNLGRQKRTENSKDKLKQAYIVAKGMLTGKNKSKLSKVTETLNNAGLRTVTGKLFTQTAVKNMINLFELGTVRPQKASKV